MTSEPEFPDDVPFGRFYEANEVAPALVWPPSLVRPSAGLCYVYLDMNHWIALAQASTGHPSGEPFAEVLRACRDSVQSRDAQFVLSSAHYFEILKISDPAQRFALGAVMEELTGYATLVSRVVVMELEFDASIEPMKPTAGVLPAIEFVGFGFCHAFGLRSDGFRIKDRETHADVTGSFREEYGAQRFDSYMATARHSLERSALCGPTDAEVGSLRAHGWNPSGLLDAVKRRAELEEGFRAQLNTDDRWRRGRLRDLVSARELIIELGAISQRVVERRGLTSVADLGLEIEDARRLVRSMPTSEVAIELKTAWHRNASKKWTANDIYDIDAMALAVPYCDVVVTEKACHHLLTTAKLDKRMNTTILRRLADLPDAIGARRS
jgi:hypothetical protein